MTYLRSPYYNSATGQSTQLDPIGLAGGLNSYGFAGGDPINFADPFGLAADLKIAGERLGKEVARLRKSNPAADATFRALEQAKGQFVIEDGSATGCQVCDYKVATSFDARSEEWRRLVPGVFDHIDAEFPKARGWAYINRSATNDPAAVAWHEAGHLKGLAEKGQLNYGHACSKSVVGIPGFACAP